MQPGSPSTEGGQPLLLAVDGRMLGPGGTGVASYARALRDAQAAIAPGSLVIADGLRPDAPVPARAGRWLRALWPAARQGVPTPAGRIVAGDVFRLAQVFLDIHRRPLVLRVAGPAGIVHWSYPLPLAIAGWRNLYTVHDAIPLTSPGLSPIDPARHRRLLAAVARGAAGFVTVSRAAQAEIVAALGCDPGFVHDCGEAVEPERPSAPLTVQLPAGLRPRGYLLAIGSVETRKNIGRMIEAWRASGTALPLVVAGPDGWGAADLADRWAGIVRLPYLPAPAVRSLIAGARALLMPSLAEGFGLPVAEAMALGTPVVTSRGGALEETAGGAAILVDARSVAEIAAGIARVAQDDALCDSLAAAGRINAQRFTKARFRERLEALYRTVA